MLDFARDRLSEEELKAIHLLRAYGWGTFSSPYVDDFSEHDLGFLAGRMSIAICKPIKN